MVIAKENLVGAWAFSIGVILAIIAGIFQSYMELPGSSIIYLLLVVAGIIIGFANAGDKNSVTFLLAALALVIVSGQANQTLQFISNLSPVLSSMIKILNALLVMFIPATVIVALKTVFSVAKV